jgi:prophage antirepressor-like protein
MKQFEFGGNAVRVVGGEDGEPQFVGKDVCDALGYTNPTKAMNDHCKGLTKRYPLATAGGVQEFRVCVRRRDASCAKSHHDGAQVFLNGAF